MMELEKECIDDKLMVLEAIEAAKFCYTKRYFETIQINSYGENNKAAEVMNGLVQQYTQASRNK